MEWIRIVVSRCVALFRRRKLDEELDAELRSHLDLAVEENLHHGMSEQAARTAALREFGAEGGGGACGAEEAAETKGEGAELAHGELFRPLRPG